MNDVFSKFGEAGGQYSYPPQVDFMDKNKEKEVIYPNPHFDLCRLSMTILEEIDTEKYSDNIIELLIQILMIIKVIIFNIRDDFKLYIDITKNTCVYYKDNNLNKIFGASC